MKSKYLDLLLKGADASAQNDEATKKYARVPDPQNPQNRVTRVLKVPTPGVLSEAGRSAGKAKELPLTAGEWTRRGIPDSRSPLIPDSIRSKIEAIEADARAAGWPAELLWNCGFWDHPRGLAAVLDEDDEIGEVTADYIMILKSRRDLLRFQRRTA